MTQAPPLQKLECDRSQCVHTHTLDFSLDLQNHARSIIKATCHTVCSNHFKLYIELCVHPAHCFVILERTTKSSANTLGIRKSLSDPENAKNTSCKL